MIFMVQASFPKMMKAITTTVLGVAMEENCFSVTFVPILSVPPVSDAILAGQKLQKCQKKAGNAMYAALKNLKLK